MNRPPPTRTAQPSAVTVVEITDPTDVGAHGLEIEQDVVQLQSVPLRARRVTVRLGPSVLIFQSTNLRIRTRTTLGSGMVAYVAFGPCSAGTANGLPVGPDRILAGASGVEVEFVVAAGYQSASFLVRPQDLCEHLRLRRRAGHPPLPGSVELMQTRPGDGPQLFAWAKRVVDAAMDHPAVFDEPRANAAAEAELFDVLLSSIGPGAPPPRTPRDGTRSAFSRVVRTAEEHALAHAGEPVYVTDLCKAASVSERTLQKAFREIMAMSPVVYLARLRLHRARLALRAARPGSTSVAAEAARWGFWHLGDFSRAYKECFGELPSTTLRRTEPVAEHRPGAIAPAPVMQVAARIVRAQQAL